MHLDQWEELWIYTTNGKLEPCDNLVENRIRPIELGCKNYMFAGDQNAAKRGAVIYTIIASCKANDINPKDYPTDMLDSMVTRKLSNHDDLLPWNWKPLEKLFKSGGGVDGTDVRWRPSVWFGSSAGFRLEPKKITAHFLE